MHDHISEKRSMCLKCAEQSFSLDLYEHAFTSSITKGLPGITRVLNQMCHQRPTGGYLWIHHAMYSYNASNEQRSIDRKGDNDRILTVASGF